MQKVKLFLSELRRQYCPYHGSVRTSYPLCTGSQC